MKKILMVEDDEVVATIYRNKLGHSGYDILVAQDGEEGLKQVKEFEPDVLVLDLGLPKIDGVEVIKLIRADAKTSKLPIIVLTNAYLANRVKDAWTAGATRCVTKSECTPRTLMEIIHKLDYKLPLASAAPETVKSQETQPTRIISPFAPVIAFPKGSELLKELNSVEGFMQQAPAAIASLRGKIKELLRSNRPETAHHYILELYSSVRSLSAKAAMAGLTRFARMSAALEAFLKEIADRPDILTASSQRTIVQGIDFLDELVRHHAGEDGEISIEGVLVVDDEPLSRRAVVFALEKVGLKCIDMESPEQALMMLSGTQFDLIFLDIDMPGMNGFELCRQIRALPHYANTQVVFVSSLTDFQSKAQSTLSGGNDLIAKPFHFLELGVKALIHLWRPQLKKAAAGK